MCVANWNLKGTFNMTKQVAIEGGLNVTVTLALLSKEEIKAGQDTIKANLTSLDKAIHDNAVQCLMHAEKHGDTSLMRRLLIDILDGKNTGYRVQGLINWMRKFSPMELKGKDINLSGLMTAAGIEGLAKQFPDADRAIFGEVGAKRPFLIEQANATFFWSDKDNDEKVAKPIYQETVLSPIHRAIKQIEDAAKNTANGKPIDATKPFYDGVQVDNVVSIVEAIKAKLAEMPKDSTLEVRRAQSRMREDAGIITANGGELPAVEPMVANG